MIKPILFVLPILVLGATVIHGQTATAAPPPAAPATDGAYAGKPYNGTPAAIPGTIQAEEYDISPNAANDVTFHYGGKITTSSHRKTPDSIAVTGFGKGHQSTAGKPEDPDQVYVGWTQPGEWLKYTVKVAEPGTYIFGGKLAAGAKDAKISASFSPGVTTGPITVPTTAGFLPGVEVYHVWETLDKLAEVKLPAGTYVLTIKIEGSPAGMNFDYFTFVKKP